MAKLAGCGLARHRQYSYSPRPRRGAEPEPEPEPAPRASPAPTPENLHGRAGHRTLVLVGPERTIPMPRPNPRDLPSEPPHPHRPCVSPGTSVSALARPASFAPAASIAHHLRPPVGVTVPNLVGAARGREARGEPECLPDSRSASGGAKRPPGTRQGRNRKACNEERGPVVARYYVGAHRA